MDWINSLLDSIPWVPLLIIALFLGIAPLGAEPHLVEKLRMLAQGTLVKPIDIFDLLMHSTPIIVVILKGIRQLQQG
ncbi:MAG: hypothetical protein HOM11_14545 [Methylococcales bacterium]|jgi:hypothetical protein|nr:hypothetical protein [Methylococcales bacterium]MBT7443873.1 hypothetical protein [Methylococcales bacterium]